jgi:hypothetical protein
MHHPLMFQRKFYIHQRHHRLLNLSLLQRYHHQHHQQSLKSQQVRQQG